MGVGRETGRMTESKIHAGKKFFSQMIESLCFSATKKKISGLQEERLSFKGFSITKASFSFLSQMANSFKEEEGEAIRKYYVCGNKGESISQTVVLE